MPAEQWKVGDVVVLKSGGPDMTIDEVLENEGQQEIICFWFLPSGERKTGAFNPLSIDKKPPPGSGGPQFALGTKDEDWEQ